MPACDGALHIEPGIWVTQSPNTFPPETAPVGLSPEQPRLLAAELERAAD
jgi:hypothetical protein